MAEMDSLRHPGKLRHQNKDVQEFTAGYWYNIYSGPKGRLRYGLQYAGSSAISGLAPAAQPTPAAERTGTDNMFWTSFRYYLP